jgi:hypothetical protein
MGLLLVAVWAWLHHHPAVAVNAIPLDVLRYIEGIAAVPIFMLIVAIAWSRSQLPRQRHVAGMAVVIGVIYYLQGGLWMLQTTPSAAMGRTPSVAGGIVLQSHDYSCVPAACATACNMLGVPTSEAAMTDLTHTRAGSGATLIRAMAGLQQRLANTRFAVALIETDYEALRNMPTPMLTSLRFEPTQRHMVVIQRIEGDAVWVADPQIGQMYYSKDEFLRYFNGQVLVFE